MDAGARHPHHGSKARAALLRRVPFTITATLVILALALASRGLWDPLAGRSVGRSVAYGLPAFEDGRVWTLATFAVFALQPVQYIPILLGFLAFGGFAEYCLGTGNAVLAFVVCHVFELARTTRNRPRQDGLVPCLFSVTQEAASHVLARGWHALQVAEEAVIDLTSLKFRGKACQDVRTALNQGAKLGISHRLAPLPEQPRGNPGAGTGHLLGQGRGQGHAGDGVHPRRRRRGP